MTRFIFLIALLFAGCAKPLPPDHVAKIRATLNATTVAQVSAPAGPFNMAKQQHTYYKVYVIKTDKTYWVDVRPSAWTIAAAAAGGNETIWAYDYYEKVPLVNYYRRVKQ